MAYCNKSLSEITFNINDIAPCNNCYSYGAPKYYTFPNVNNPEELKERRYNILKSISDPSLIRSYSCKNCIHLIKDDDVPFETLLSKKINLITLRYWTTCNCNCVHCDNLRNKIYGLKPQYNPIEIIEELYKQELLDKENLTINFHGGDIGVLENFENLVNLFNINGYKNINFSTNNIIYQPLIGDLIAKNKAGLNTSLDSGTKETYLKIKQVDGFDSSVNNLMRYLSNTTNNRECISVHYVIIEGYNDNVLEIDKFLKLMRKIGIRVVGVRIDHKDLDKYLVDGCDYTKVKKYMALVNYFNERADLYKLKLDNDSCLEQKFALYRKPSFLKRIFSFFNKES